MSSTQHPAFLPRARRALLLALGCGLLGFARAQDSGDHGFARAGRPERTPIFFPPLPPALDPGAAPPNPGVIHPSAPAELMEFVGEYFYPQLGSRLKSNRLTDRQRQQLTSYRSAKLALQQAIRLELAATHDAAPAERHHALQALARRQAEPLAALARTAEELRVTLAMTERSWGSYREWRLSERQSRGYSPREIAQVMRAFAFYERHLTVDQRALLREIACELLLAARDVRAATAAQAHVFFSPSPARVPWRDDLTPAVAAKFAAYLEKKATLKKELYDAICSHDDRSLRILSNPVVALAEKQGPRLAALETLAEEIRVALASLPAAAFTPPRSPLPPRLAEQAAHLNRRRDSLRKEATLRMETVAA
ncbi:MAG TPA: hypothetical protein VM029_02185, partial [Opitutaceae bacterium]|nr:hypothetical protein [Opitutaceae bacterium]